MAEAGPRQTSGQPRPVMLPLILLIILGMAGLRGAVSTPQWDGAQRHGLVIGVALEAILGVLLLIAIRRRFAAERTEPGTAVSDVAPRLRAALIFVLVTGMAVGAVALLLGLHLHLSPVPPGQAGVQPSPSVTGTGTGKLTPGPGGFSFHVPPLSDVLYGLLIAALAAAAAVSVWWSRQLKPSRRRRRCRGGLFAKDPEDLREAVESGRWALHSVDDTRAAIIACYVAMENSLAERGAARGIADTPDELLARATESGLVRGTAAARLTALFYEARFSSHPMDRGQRDAAERALDELAAAVAVPFETGPSRTGPFETGPSRTGPSKTEASP